MLPGESRTHCSAPDPNRRSRRHWLARIPAKAAESNRQRRYQRAPFSSDGSRTVRSWPGTGAFSAQAGAFQTRSAALAVAQPVGSHGAVEVLGEDFTTEGFPVVAAGQRGAVDVAAWTRHRSWSAQWRERLGDRTEISATVRGFEERRGNGTPYQQNGTRARVASIRADGQVSDAFGWTAAVFAQDQSYASTFSSVNATRSAETPASNQFAVPAVGGGASWTGAWRTALSDTGFGVDARNVHGETRELYSYTAGDFTRLRVAGGTQTLLGAFVTHRQRLAPSLDLTLGARLDDWTEANGHRWELVRATGAVARGLRNRNRFMLPSGRTGG